MEKAKEKILEDICNELRRISKKYPEEFFIIKDTRDFPIDNTAMTIGAKVLIPSATNKELEE
jgi:hypothetical protein